MTVLSVPEETSEEAGYRARNACITVHTDSGNREDALAMREHLKKFAGYSQCVIGVECGKEGRWHLQMFAEFSGRGIYARQFYKYLGKHCFFTRRNGPQVDAINYCKKGSQSKAEWRAHGIHGPNYGVDADVWEPSDMDGWNAQGKDSDLMRIMDAIQSGETTFNIAAQYPDKWLRYEKSIAKALEHQRSKRVHSARPMVELEREAQVQWEDHTMVIVDLLPAIARELAFARYPKALRVTHLNMLTNLDPDYHDAVVFDNMSLDMETASNIMETRYDASFARGYEMSCIPAGFPRVILCRDPMASFITMSHHYPHKYISQIA